MPPSGWTESTVGAALNIDNTKRKPLNIEERSRIRGSYPYYGPTKIQDWINEYAYEGRYALIGEDGDHFLKYRTENMTQIADGQFNVNNHAHVLAGTATCTVDWFYYYFQNRSIAPFLSRQGAKRYKLNKASLQNIPILLPPISEQVTITEILSTWDEAIKVCDALVSTSRAQKRALTQALLLGDKRLPSFKGKWRNIAFSSLFERVRENNVALNKNVLTISAQHGLVSQTDYFTKNIAGSDLSTYTLLKKGDFAYNKSYSAGFPMGAIKPLELYADGIVSSLYLCFRLVSQDSEHRFLKHYFEAGIFNREIYGIAQEGARNHGLLNVGINDFFTTRLHLPSLQEQRAIANVIDAAELDFRKLQQYGMQLRREKSALMQDLLTGKRRVKVDKVKAA